jgi:hypothetical protein
MIAFFCPRLAVWPSYVTPQSFGTKSGFESKSRRLRKHFGRRWFLNGEELQLFDNADLKLRGCFCRYEQHDWLAESQNIYTNSHLTTTWGRSLTQADKWAVNKKRPSKLPGRIRFVTVFILFPAISVRRTSRVAGAVAVQLIGRARRLAARIQGAVYARLGLS